MRILLVAAALLTVLAGCSGPAAEPPRDLASGDAQGEAPSTGTLVLNRTVMRFAAGDQEASMPLEVTFSQTEACLFAVDICGAAVKHLDLTPVVPADVPVELSVELSGDGNYDMVLQTTDATLLRYSEEYDSGTYRLDASLVRAASGTLTLSVQYVLPSVGSADAAVLEGVAHSISRADVVPAFVPAAVELGPGDTIRASGGGLEELVLFPPSGMPVRAAAAPFNVTVPLGYPTGTYLVVASADEAVKLRGPDRPLSARQLGFTQTEPVDLVVGQEVTWEMPIAGYPLMAGLGIVSKATTNDMAVAAYAENMRVALTSPANVDVITGEQDCIVFVDCGMTIAGRMSYGYHSDLLDEHLVTGTYTGKVTLETGRDMQAYSWALTVS